MPSNSFRGFMDSLHESNRAMEQWMRGYPDPSQIQRSHSSQSDAWAPEIEVISERSNLIIVVELPGVKPEEIEVALSDDLLTIYGEKREHSSEGERYMRERRAGIFRRSLTLPSEVSENSISTNLEDGVLEITIEDYAGLSEPRRVEVKGSAQKS